MVSRRRFLASVAAAATAPALNTACASRFATFSALRSDPNGILDLPAGFQYTIVSSAGTTMSDGLRVPGAHDGMAAFPAPDGRIALVCNHELKPAWTDRGAFGDAFSALPEAVRRRVYDRGDGRNPGLGGTTTTIYNPETGATERQFLSLAGTEANCAGGPTPWGSWLSCEECFSPVGSSGISPRVTRARHHGYVFEVPSAATELTEAQPLKAMGRFEHEAAAVDSTTGIVYMTEDRHFGLFYRYIPSTPGRLQDGGRLQALAIDGQPSKVTHNWSDPHDIALRQTLPVRWLDLDDVDPVENDLRLRGAAAGAATFARGEGLCATGKEMVFACTIGGPARLGQVFAYTPGRQEGSADETADPGRLELIAEATPDSLLRNADNITIAPWGDLILCEDTSGHCGLVGVRPDGTSYALADNPHSNSELAGACFAPDGNTLFVNIQYPGMTLAVTGPWPSA